MAASAGKVRAARLTDLSALGELSRLAQADGEGTRSLGLPVAGPPIGVFTLFRLPLGAFTPARPPVRLRPGRSPGGPAARGARELPRRVDVVELDAVGDLDAGDIRFRLVQHLLRDGAKRVRSGSTWPAPTRTATWSCSCRRGSLRYGDERVCSGPGRAAAGADDRRGGRGLGIREARSQDALALSRLYASSPRARCSAWRRSACPTGSARAASWRVPRSSWRRSCGSPTSRRSCRMRPTAASDGTQLDAFVQVGVAKEDQPHYLKVLARPGADVVPLLRFGLGVIAARARGGDRAPTRA